MGKKGKKAQAGKPKKPTPKDIGKRLDALVKQLEKELEGADMFAPLTPTEDCPICLVPLPRRQNKSYYKVCCGKTICHACVKENDAAIKVKNEKNAGNKDRPVIRDLCPFCRAPVPLSFGEALTQFEERKLHNDYRVFHSLAIIFDDGQHGQAEDKMKALDHFIRAIELGSPESPSEIASLYREGTLTSQNMERSALFTKVAAIRGNVEGRHNIGAIEYDERGNHELGIRHWKITAEGGSQPSLNALKAIYNADGEVPGKKFISKEDLDNVYRSCHEAQAEVSSEKRKKHWGSKNDKWKC